MTRADWAQCEALYARDAIWEMPAHGIHFDSAAAFLEMLEGTSTADVMIQTPHAPVINLVDPDRAQATTTIHEWIRAVSPIDSADGRTGDQMNFEAYGVYFDDITRIDGEWKFTHRQYRLISTAMVL